jgi:hypothetical protein
MFLMTQDFVVTFKKDTVLIFFRVKHTSWTTITIHQSVRRHVTDDAIILRLHFQSTIVTLEISNQTIPL